MRRQQIVETVHCDRCDEETDSPSTYTISFATGGSPVTRTVDLCPEHAPMAAELLTMMRGMKRQIAAPTSVPAVERPGRPVSDCDVCGRSVAASSLASHIVKAHRASAPQPPQCPDCGHAYTSQEMLKHRREKHGYVHADALLASLDTSPKRKRSR